jgi:hypothetical protein
MIRTLLILGAALDELCISETVALQVGERLFLQCSKVIRWLHTQHSAVDEKPLFPRRRSLL